MSKKKLTIQAETVDLAIKNGLKEVGLKQADVFIKILQRNIQGLVFSKNAIVAIYYDGIESTKAIAERRAKEFESKFKLQFSDSKAYIKVPIEFYDTEDLPSKEDKEEWLRAFLEKNFIKEPEADALEQILTDKQCTNTLHTSLFRYHLALS